MPTDAGNEFYVIPNESSIPPAKKDQVMLGAEKLQGILSELFPRPCRYGSCKPGEYSGATVINRLVDTPETRIGPEPEGSARDQMVRQANLAIETGAPIALVGIWGTPRHLESPEVNSAQLSDLAALMMVQGALDRVASAHPEGAYYHAVDENLTALWLDIAQHPLGAKGESKFKWTYRTYYNDRARLVAALEAEGLINRGNTKIELVSETDQYRRIWKKKGSEHFQPEYDFLAKCEQVRPAIVNYLISSGEAIGRFYGPDDNSWQSSTDNPQLWADCEREILARPESSKLKEVGWSGLIPPEMRKYYLAKFRNIIGQADLKANDPLLLFHVATYLSSTLVKSKAGTLTEGLPEGAPIIKVPLVKPVDGRPPTHQALVAQRTLPNPEGPLGKRVSNTNRSAWGSVAVFGDKKLRLVGVEEFLRTPAELVVPADVYMVGPDNGAGSYLVNTAIVLS